MADCTVECEAYFGINCDPSQSQSKQQCYALGNCGDGVHDTSEVCDDGNLLDNDGCSSECQIETGYYCDPTVAALTD